MAITSLPCPTCRKMVTWQENPNRPFCSNRCQSIDLGQWATESYRLPGSEDASMIADEDERQG
jgi:uncharacterized protein